MWDVRGMKDEGWGMNANINWFKEKWGPRGNWQSHWRVEGSVGRRHRLRWCVWFDRAKDHEGSQGWQRRKVGRFGRTWPRMLPHGGLPTSFRDAAKLLLISALLICWTNLKFSLKSGQRYALSVNWANFWEGKVQREPLSCDGIPSERVQTFPLYLLRTGNESPHHYLHVKK